MANFKIVLLDDDPAVCASLQFILELHGFDVETFASAEALTAFAGPDEPACFIHTGGVPALFGQVARDPGPLSGG